MISNLSPSFFEKVIFIVIEIDIIMKIMIIKNSSYPNNMEKLFTASKARQPRYGDMMKKVKKYFHM
jgi:hypothetical protein